VVEPARAFIPNWHMDAMAEHAQAVAEGKIRKLLVTVPPGSSKSIVWAVQWPAWMWVPKRNPGWRSTFASYASTLAERDSVRCRNLLHSVWYRETFRPDWSFATDQNVKSYFVNSAMGHRFSTSVGATATGFRGDAIVVDDPLQATDRNSDAAILAMVDWWTNEMFNRLNDMVTGTKVIIMQRLSERDLAGHVLREGGYEHLMIPMEYDPARSRATVIGWQDPRAEKGDLMFPQLFPREIVDLELKKDEARWNAQYQQQPITEGGGILKSHHWNYWQPPGAHLPVVRVKMPDATIEERRAVELPEAFDLELQSWDCTFKEVKDADYVVGMAIAVRGANRYIRPDLTRARLDLPGTIAAVRAMTGRYPKTFSKLIEGKANGPAVIQMLRGEVSGLLDIEPEGGKVARANGASPELRSGNWFLPHPLLAPWVGNPENPTESGFLAEAVVFPFGPNDDMVDAWTQAGIWIQKDGAGRVFLTSEQDIRVESVQIGQKWPRMFGMFVSPREVAAVWIFRRPETGEHFVAVEYTAPASDPVKHAAELVKLGAWIPGVVHTKGTGRDERDGKAMTQKYRDLGVKGLEGVQDNIAAEIIGLQEALSAGKLKVCSNLHRWFDQYRLVRRDEKGALPHYNVGVIMATLAAWRHKDKMRAPLEPAAPAQVQRGPLPNGWMGA
jgi:predicted phage terminase large subunit-like protein